MIRDWNLRHSNPQLIFRANFFLYCFSGSMLIIQFRFTSTHISESLLCAKAVEILDKTWFQPSSVVQRGESLDSIQTRVSHWDYVNLNILSWVVSLLRKSALFPINEHGHLPFLFAKPEGRPFVVFVPGGPSSGSLTANIKNSPKHEFTHIFNVCIFSKWVLPLHSHGCWFSK